MKYKERVTAIMALLCLFFSSISWAQQNGRFDLKGTVKGAKGELMAGANLQLVKDSSMVLVKLEVSGTDGKFTFSQLPAGKYRLMATHYEHALYKSEVIELSKDIELGVVLPANAIALEEVKVEVQKPLVEQYYDKTVLNVENSISAAGSNALEVLEKAPGISIDQNDNISMRGKGGVMVMIDGKRVPMSGSELVTMLRGMSANSVAKIDLVTNPSAKYDAAGNAGIIDIKLKKENRAGTNGSISSSFGQGQKSKTNQGIQLNHRTEKFNFFGNYNYVYRGDFNKLDIYREFYNEGREYTGAYDQKNRMNLEVNSHTARAGVDFNLSSKTVVGVVANGNFTNIGRGAGNSSRVLNRLDQYESSFLTDSKSKAQRDNQSVNLNFKHAIDTTGREITADLDYASYQPGDEQDITTNYYNLAGEMIKPTYLLHGNLDGKLTIRSAKVDYAQPLPAIKANLEAGLKSSSVHADNNLEFYDRSNGGNVLDLSKSNHFIYDEDIHAAYLNANKKWQKVSLQLGLRLENTIAKGKQLTNGEEFDRNYTQLFPSAFIGYTVNEKHDVGLSLSRRIDRPTYNQLNPFKYFLDPSTYSAGNPFLKPQLTYSFEFTHTFKQKIITKLSYSHTTDNILTVLAPDPDEEKVVRQMDQNLTNFDYYGLTFAVPITVTQWFTSTNNVEFYYGLYQGNLASTNLKNGRPTFVLNSNNSFTLKKGWSAEMIGVYRSREVYGFLDIQPIRYLSLGVQKQLWDKKANVKLNVTDMFYSNKARGYTELSNYKENFYQRRDTRVATLSFTYRFGGKPAAPTRRTGGAEEEKRRAQ